MRPSPTRPCNVPGCKNAAAHQLPVDGHQRSLWMKAMKIKDWMLKGSRPSLCSIHFKDTDYMEAYYQNDMKPTRKRNLKRHAVPSLFPGRETPSTLEQPKFHPLEEPDSQLWPEVPVVEFADPLGSEDMKPLACRACLAVERPLRPLQRALATVYGELTGTTVSESDIYPKFLCSYCCALLAKFAEFRKVCLSAQKTFCNLCTADGPIPLDLIKSVPYPNLETTEIKRICTDQPENCDFISNYDDYDEYICDDNVNINYKDKITFEDKIAVAAFEEVKVENDINEEAGRGQNTLEIDFENNPSIHIDRLENILKEARPWAGTRINESKENDTNNKEHEPISLANQTETEDHTEIANALVEPTNVEVGIECDDDHSHCAIDSHVAPHSQPAGTSYTKQFKDLGTAPRKKTKMAKTVDGKVKTTIILLKSNLKRKTPECSTEQRNQSYESAKVQQDKTGIADSQSKCDPSVEIRLQAEDELSKIARRCEDPPKLVQLKKERAPETRFICEICGRSMSNRLALEGHVRLHTGERPYQCDIDGGCGKGLISKQARREHILFEHMGRKRPRPTKAFGCQFCKNKFKCKSDVERHVMSVHKKIRPFGCEHCDNVYASKQALQNHVATRHDELPWPKRQGAPE